MERAELNTAGRARCLKRKDWWFCEMRGTNGTSAEATLAVVNWEGNEVDKESRLRILER